MLTPLTRRSNRGEALRRLALLGVGAVLAVPTGAQAQCRAADSTSARMIATLRDYVTATDSASVAGRTKLGLDATTASSVTLVTTTGTCQQAVAAHNAAMPGPSTSYSNQVYVVAVGRTRYAVLDPAYATWTPPEPLMVIFTDKWVKKSITPP